MSYEIIQGEDGYYAKLASGSLIGPYLTEGDVDHEMEQLTGHISSGCFGGAK